MKLGHEHGFRNKLLSSALSYTHSQIINTDVHPRRLILQILNLKKKINFACIFEEEKKEEWVERNKKGDRERAAEKKEVEELKSFQLYLL